MQLAGERSVFGYFGSPGKAEAAAQALRQEGYSTVQIDQVSRHADLGTGSQQLRNPATGQINSLAELVLGVKDVDVETGILLSASADASGYGAEKDLPGGRAYLVTVVTKNEENRVQRAVELLKAHGGQV